jgi:hypothetical protein
MKSQQPELLDARSKEKMKRAKKFEKRLKNKKGNKNSDFHINERRAR